MVRLIAFRNVLVGKGYRSKARVYCGDTVGTNRSGAAAGDGGGSTCHIIEVWCGGILRGNLSIRLYKFGRRRDTGAPTSGSLSDSFIRARCRSGVSDAAEFIYLHRTRCVYVGLTVCADVMSVWVQCVCACLFVWVCTKYNVRIRARVEITKTNKR